MPFAIRRLLRYGLLAVFAVVLALGLVAGCASMADEALTDAISAPASAIEARSGAEVMGPHMLMTEKRPAQPGDEQQADRMAAELREHIAQYRDVEKARADGYRSFPPNPGPDLKEVHYIHPERSRRENEEIDLEKPGSLLYHQTEDGGLRLVGAMVIAPAEAPLEELDARVPLSVTQWHLHTNICVPKPIWDEAQWARTADDGQPLFGPGSRIATEDACGEVDGRFMPTIFGWMAHAYVYAEDEADMWDPHYGMGGHGGGHH